MGAPPVPFHLSHRERSDRPCDPGEGLRLTIDRNPSPQSSPNGRGSELRCCDIDASPTKYTSEVQLLIPTEDAFLVEGDPALACEIRFDVRPRGDAIVQIDQPRYLALERLHALRKCIAEPLDDLEQREIGVGDPAAGEIGTAMALQ